MNSEISEAALIVGNTIEITTDPAKTDKAWVPNLRDYEFNVVLSRPNQPRRLNEKQFQWPESVPPQRKVRLCDLA